jgi:hypothetical protein
MTPKTTLRSLALCAALAISSTARAADAVPPPAPTAHAPDPMAHFYVFGVGLGLGVGGAISWKYRQTWTGKFTTINEGWFGKDTYAGGADKLGHFYTDYLLVRGLHHIYASYGYDESSALLNALIGSMAIRTTMEVADGYTTFKFSPQDLIANMSGSLTSYFLLQHPALDDAVGMSWTYLPSQEKLDGKVSWSSIDNDYNGSIYHLDLRLKGFMRLVSDAPIAALDPYTVGLSYETRGYDRVREYKQRLLGLTVGLNLAEIISGFAEPGGALDKSTVLVKYYKVPFTFGGVMYDLDHDRWGARFGLSYFY